VSTFDQHHELRSVSLRLLVSVVTVGSVGALVVTSDLTVWSLSPAAALVGGVFAILTGVAEHVESLEAAFECGQSLLVRFTGVLFILMSLQQQFTPAVLLGLAAGAGAGSLVSAAAVLAVFSCPHSTAKLSYILSNAYESSRPTASLAYPRPCVAGTSQ